MSCRGPGPSGRSPGPGRSRLRRPTSPEPGHALFDGPVEPPAGSQITRAPCWRAQAATSLSSQTTATGSGAAAARPARPSSGPAPGARGPRGRRPRRRLARAKAFIGTSMGGLGRGGRGLCATSGHRPRRAVPTVIGHSVGVRPAQAPAAGRARRRGAARAAILVAVGSGRDDRARDSRHRGRVVGHHRRHPRLAGRARQALGPAPPSWPPAITERREQSGLPTLDPRLPWPVSRPPSLAEAVDGAPSGADGRPSHGFRDVLGQPAPSLTPGAAIVSLAKGIETGTNLRMSEVVGQVAPGHPAGVLTGPNLAREVAEGQPAATVVALPNVAGPNGFRLLHSGRSVSIPGPTWWAARSPAPRRTSWPSPPESATGSGAGGEHPAVLDHSGVG